MIRRISLITSKGFTFIELLVIILVISLIAAIVAPNVLAMKQGRETKNFLSTIRAFSVRARTDAITRGQTMVMTVDTTQHQVTLNVDDSTDTLGASPSSIPEQISAGGTSSSPLPEYSAANIPVPEGTTLQTFKLGLNDSNEGDFKLHFYPDGRSEGGGFEISQGGLMHSFVVATDGSNKMLDGNYPDQSQEKWAAGDYARRL